jgi:hypothetical protein
MFGSTKLRKKVRNYKEKVREKSRRRKCPLLCCCVVGLFVNNKIRDPPTDALCTTDSETKCLGIWTRTPKGQRQPIKQALRWIYSKLYRLANQRFGQIHTLVIWSAWSYSDWIGLNAKKMKTFDRRGIFVKVYWNMVESIAFLLDFDTCFNSRDMLNFLQNFI